VAEVILTALLVFTVPAATDRIANVAFGHPDRPRASTSSGIPITNLSVNPARSIAPALFVGDWALAQLWLFIVAPLVGAALGAAAHTGLFAAGETVPPEESAVAADVGRRATAV
jgi:aquaporin Z